MREGAIAALEIFTAHYQLWMTDEYADDAPCPLHSKHTFGDLRRARAILASLRSPPAPTSELVERLKKAGSECYDWMSYFGEGDEAQRDEIAAASRLINAALQEAALALSSQAQEIAELQRIGSDTQYIIDELRAARLTAEQERAAPRVALPPLQKRVHNWMLACFGSEIAADKVERNHRFIEEALELVQANGCTVSEAHQLVDYVYGRDQGDINQEVGGVMVTLAALCTAIGVDMDASADTEIARVWTKIEKIRARQAAKPKHSPLPEGAK